MNEDSTYPLEIDVQTAKSMLSSDEIVHLIDVREPAEVDHCHIEGCLAIPMGSIPERLNELSQEHPLIIQCHHGGRSMQVVQYLRQHGFNKSINLAGGIDQWSIHIDPSIPRY